MRGVRLLVVDPAPLVLIALDPLIACTWKLCEVSTCDNVKDASRAIASARPPDIVLVELELCEQPVAGLPPGGGGDSMARLCPAPHLGPVAIAMSHVPQQEGTARARTAGIDHYWCKNGALEELRACLEMATPEWTCHGKHAQVHEALAAAAADALGHMSLDMALRVVRSSMTHAAMQVTRGNRTRAAAILDVSAQALRHRERTQAASPSVAPGGRLAPPSPKRPGSRLPSTRKKTSG